MQAKDIMTTKVETVAPDTRVNEIAERLIARNISAVPVVDAQGRVIGIVSEGDLMRRSENETERQPSWWIRVFAEPQDRARDYIKSHGLRAKDIMTPKVVSVSEEASLADIAETLEKHHIKRVTVMRGNELVGIVSRANLLRGLVAAGAQTAATQDDREIKAAIERAFKETGVNTDHISVVVADGVATLWGMAASAAERTALGVAAEQGSGAKQVDNNINIMPAMVRMSMGAS